MSNSYLPLQAAALQCSDAGSPVSAQYGDVYQPQQDSVLRQAREVFLAGNQIPQRWQGRECFTVCETGFGLGMNFLALWHAWRSDRERAARLHVVSLEAHPLSCEELTRVHARLPLEVAPLAAQLRAQWPARLPGLHRLEFDAGAITLTLGFGLAHVLAPELCATVDAFFLDGFSPARNPEMWRPDLFAALARLAAPGATLATWCSAGGVRRALQDAGFAVTRVAGSHGKRHVTRAVYQGMLGHVGMASHAAPHTRDALIIGAGLAGAGIAHALALRGWQVDVFDPALAQGVAGSHQGHVAAALTPVIARDDNIRARLSRAGSFAGQARWQHLPGEAAPWRCGTLQPARDVAHAERIKQTLAVLDFPEDWVRWLDRDAARRISGLPLKSAGVYFCDGLLVRPDKLLAALLGGCGTASGLASSITLHARRIAALQPSRIGWKALDEQGRVLADTATVVLANSISALALLPADSLAALPRIQAMHALAGEISLLPSAMLAGGPRCIVGGAGYLLPAVDGWCVAGSTYVHGARHAQVSPAGRQVNLTKAANLSGLAEDGLTHVDPACGWAGWRAVIPGRLPAIGPVPHAPGLWLATGYASRGLTWSALAGEIIGAALEQEPLPLERDLLTAIAPR